MVVTVLDAGSEKAAAHRLGLSHSTFKHHLANARSKVGAETTAQLVWILGPRLPEPASRVDGSTAGGLRVHRHPVAQGGTRRSLTAAISPPSGLTGSR